MKILITGIHGFIGSNLAAGLGNQHEIYGLSRDSKPVVGVKRIYKWSEINSLPDVDAVIHLAALVHDLNGKFPEKEVMEVNVGLTERMLEWFGHSSARKFLFFSSVGVYGASLANGVNDESLAVNPATFYAKSKLEAEKLLQAGFEKLPGDRSLIILRPGMIHGPGHRGNLLSLCKVAGRGIPWPLGAFDNRRSFATMDNVAFIVNELIERQVASGVYNLCDDEPMSTNRIVELIYEANGRRPRIWKVPKALVRALAAIGSALRLPLDTPRLRKLTGNYTVSNAKLKKALGLDHMPVKAEDGMRESIKTLLQR